MRELQGLPCFALELAPARKQEIACTRSFGQPLTHLVDLGEAVTKFASRAAHKLRAQGSLAGQVLVFIRTSPFRPEAQFSRSISMPLSRPCADTSVIAAAALRGLRAIYRQGYQLAMAGGMLLDLQPCTVLQSELDLKWNEAPYKSKTAGLMSAMDALNQRYGRGTVNYGQRRAWRGPPDLVDEAGAAQPGLHDLLGGHASGAGLKREAECTAQERADQET